MDTYPLHDDLDVELSPDSFYSISPDYFGWDDRQSGGIYRRMIQRYSRQLVNGPPALPYEWLGCGAAQVLAEVERHLSMLVQGLVKARSDAVDGDGAVHFPPITVVTGGAVGTLAAALPDTPVAPILPVLPAYTSVVSTTSSPTPGGASLAGAATGVPGTSFFFGKHIYRLNAPLTAVDPVDPQIPSRLNPPGSISLWFYAVHRAYS